MDALIVDSVSKEYPGVLALNEISFSVKENSVHGFLGPNGAGKSTCMNIISGLTQATSGSVKVFSENIDKKTTSSFVGFLPENPPLYFNMTVKDYLKFVVSIFSDKSYDQNFYDQIIVKCGLSSVLDRLIGNLSKGFKQRVGIAGTLVHNPKLVILDEPTVGLDPKAIIEIRELIRDLSKEHTILFSSHQLSEVKALCTDITIINKGLIVTSDNLNNIEKKFSSSTKLICLVDAGDREYFENLELLKGINSTEIFTSGELLKVELFYDSKKVSKKDILKKFIDENIGIHEFFEDKIELEEIFNRAIQENDI